MPPSPETLRVIQMFLDNAEDQQILQYLNANQQRIDVNYMTEDLFNLILYATQYESPTLMKKVLQMGARIDEDIAKELMEYIWFDRPVAQARELMNLFLNAGFPKKLMLHALCQSIEGAHKELLKTLLEQPIDINYKHYGNTCLHSLTDAFIDNDDEVRGIFMEMLRMLIQKGANPNEVNNEGKTVIQMVNESLADRNPGPILRILQTRVAPAAPVDPEIIALEARVRAAEEEARVARERANAAASGIDYIKLWASEIIKKNPNIALLEECIQSGKITIIMMTAALKYKIKTEEDRDNLELFEFLLKSGADPNETDQWGNIAYFNVIIVGSIKDMTSTMKLLIKYGADLKKIFMDTNCLSRYILMISERRVKYMPYHEKFMDVLIEGGADIHFRDSKGRDMIDICIEYLLDALDFFLKKNMPVIKNGRTRVYSAIVDIKPQHERASSVKKIIFVLKTLLKYHATHDDYFRDYLDAAIVNSSISYVLNDIYKEMKNILTPNYNAVYIEGSTPLINAVKLYTENPNPWVKEMIHDFLKEGANPSYIDPTGKKAVDYTTDEELSKLLGEPKFKILWTGFSKADVAFTNEIFHQTTHVSNLAKLNPDESLFSICPVCLKYIQHETGTCMYMSHSCVEQAGYEGYYHKKLWNAFSYEKEYNALGVRIPPELRKRVIEWCTHCGRICKGHRHYALQPLYKPGAKEIQIPGFAGSADAGDYFAVTCAKPKIGGGGIKEKLNRYRRFREVVLALNKPAFVGKMTYEDAINKLVEAVWEAPLDPRRFEIDMIESEKQYNNIVSNTRFPLPSELPTPPKYVYSSPAYPDASNPDLMPIVYPTATTEHKNSAFNVFGDDENIVQFRHRMTNGAVNVHAGPNQQIALGRLMGYLQHMCDTPQSADFGMCWQHSRDGYTVVNDTSNMPPQCTAKLYPEEVLHAINLAAYSDEAIKQQHMNVYQLYKMRFSERFGKPIGFAGGTRKRRMQKGRTRKH